MAPPLRIVEVDGTVKVDVQTLGEYSTTVRRVRLTDRGSGRVIWEIGTASGTPQIHTMTLTAGENAAVLSAAHGEYAVVTPQAGRSFSLERGRDYLIEIWGDNASASPARAEFQVGRGKDAS